MLSKIVFSPEKYNRKYYFSFSKSGNNENKTLAYNIDLKKEAENPFIELIRSNLGIINNQKPDDTLIGGLVYKTSELLYPLKLNLTETGYISKIISHGEILSRWRNKKDRLQAECGNNHSIEILERIGKLFENHEKLLSELKNDWFYSAFFLPIYQNYREGLHSLKYKFPVSPYDKAVYNIELELIEKENNTIEILVKGVSEDEERNILAGTYMLNPDRSIHAIHLQFGFPLKKEEIRIEIQELENKNLDYKVIGVLYDADKEQEEKEKHRNSRSFFLDELN